jgi:CRISPR system Cascade subunit CasC
MTARFVQIHALLSYSSALLNRDDSGLAKRMPYGPAIRTRVSSQCLKRHWRTADGPWALSAIGPDMAVRSRKLPEERILPALQGVGTEAVRNAVTDALAVQLYGKNAAKDRSSRQALLIGEPEIAYLADKARAAAAEPDEKTAAAAIEKLFRKEEKANLSEMLKAKGALNAGLEAALFGRMVTSDPDANTDAPVHVAHAFTVHGEQSEIDYFTVVDDLETGTGAGGIFDTELTAGLFYVYVVVDVPLLVSNLGGDAVLAGKVVEHLVHLIATTSPGAKKGSTAPYAYADFVLAETGARPPRSLSGAFRDPARPSVVEAARALRCHLTKLDTMYGEGETRRLAALDPVLDENGEPATGKPIPAPMPLDRLAADVAADVAASATQAAA